MKMNQNQNQKQVSQVGQSTFVATIRTDLRMIASIAKLMESEGDHAGTLGKVASEAIRILSSMSQKMYPVDTYEKAVMELRRMGYNDPMARGTRHYTAMQKKLGFEQRQKDVEDELGPIVRGLMKEGIGQSSVSEENIKTVKEQLGITSEAQPVVEESSERSINIPKGASKNKVHTYLRSDADEQRDIKKQNDAFASPPPVTGQHS